MVKSFWNKAIIRILYEGMEFDKLKNEGLIADEDGHQALIEEPEAVIKFKRNSYTGKSVASEQMNSDVRENFLDRFGSICLTISSVSALDLAIFEYSAEEALGFLSCVTGSIAIRPNFIEYPSAHSKLSTSDQWW